MQIHVPKDLNPGPITSAIYQAVISKLTAGKSKAGNNKFDIEVTIQSQGPNESEVTVGRKVFDNMTFTESALWKVGATYKGVTGDDLPEGDYSIDELMGLVSSALTGKTVFVSVKTEESEGYKPKNVIEKYQQAV